MIMKDDKQAHAILRSKPILFASIGAIHTLLSAGIVFGWASLLPVLRDEDISLSPSQFAGVFTHGAIGNYLSSLPFGLLLDRCGPKLCGITASLLFGIGLLLCSFATTSTTCLDIGFGIIGFAGPAIQLPTLHLARLFPEASSSTSSKEEGGGSTGGGGGAALFMSAQAGAFDGGTFVFAIVALFAELYGLTSTTFFRLYLIVPCFTLLTAVFFWPHSILQEESSNSSNDDDDDDDNCSYIGMGSPYLSPATIPALKRKPSMMILKDAPLSLVLSKPPFYCLAFWVSIHILKLNFVVATLNDQLHYAVAPDVRSFLIKVFGAMLPFGFVVLPLVATLLMKSSFITFQLANVVGILYGAVLTFFPGVPSYQIGCVFVSVAISRQLVYSTVFHQTGELFGFTHYGVLLGLTNLVVSGVSLVQGPLVEWAEARRNYFGPNVVLLIATLPLFGVVYGALPSKRSSASTSTGGKQLHMQNRTIHDDAAAAALSGPNEETVLLVRPRSNSLV
jgi:MFS family permease